MYSYIVLFVFWIFHFFICSYVRIFSILSCLYRGKYTIPSLIDFDRYKENLIENKKTTSIVIKLCGSGIHFCNWKLILSKHFFVVVFNSIRFRLLGRCCFCHKIWTWNKIYWKSSDVWLLDVLQVSVKEQKRDLFSTI